MLEKIMLNKILGRTLMALSIGVAAARPPLAASQDRPPNVIIIFADDLGYGDLGVYGHPTIHTPALDRMAAEGMRFTQFYSAACVCTPSRAALLTGRLPIRSGMCSNRRRVLFPNSTGGLPAKEITIAEALGAKGYATACVGKWHLGHLPQYLPTRNGFDEYFGIPYSNDMDRNKPPVMRGEKVIEQPAVQETLTRRYTQECLKFIRKNRDRPFFLYNPHTFPHIPLYASDKFRGTSRRGLYGDVVEEIDWSVGRILETLRTLGIEKNTLVFFTSDNGPWLTKKLNGGSAGLLRDGKGSTWEGGMREPGIAWWPGRIRAGSVTRELGSTMDLFTTCLTLAGAEIPTDRIIDGKSLLPILLGTGQGGRDVVMFYRGQRLMAVRSGPWKMHLLTQASYGQRNPERRDPPLLFNLHVDPSEKYDVAREHANVIADIMEHVTRHLEALKPAPSQLELKLEKKGASR